MIDFLLSRPVVIALAVLGAVLAGAASVLQARIGPAQAKRLNLAGYGAMGLSMLLFIVAGLRGPPS